MSIVDLTPSPFIGSIDAKAIEIILERFEVDESIQDQMFRWIRMMDKIVVDFLEKKKDK